MGTRRLLILDDDVAVGKVLSSIATRMGIEVRCTTQAEEFLGECDRWIPTDIAIDLVMPDMDGVEVMRHLASRSCTARIFITSGIGGRVLEAARRSATERGLNVVGVFSKPFEIAGVRSLLGVDGGQTAVRTAAKRPATQPGLDVTATELRRALDHHEFQLAYQPKINCATGAVAGFEALVRWKHPTVGIVMPDRFIPIAEQLDLIDELTEQVFDLGLNWLGQRFPNSPLALSVNISGKSLVDLRLADHIGDLCHRLAIDPSRMIWELTESSAMKDPIAALDLLTRLRIKGFHLSIDDFGTGYSSMVQLVRLPFSEMKVDKSFVMIAMKSSEARAVIRSIVDLGHSLGLSVTAEGVEDAETLDFLKTIGCDLAQGYFIARPMDGELVADWIVGRELSRVDLSTGVSPRPVL